MLNATIASPQRHRSLTLFPLVAQDSPELPYSLMSDALSDGFLRITEVGSGTVPELLATNASDTVILALDGEQLVGARQNRTTNRSILLPPKSETKIPVSCMEQGRWHFQSDHFAPAPQSSPAAVRRQAREVEAEHARAGVAAPPQALAMAQGKVWHAIADHSSKLHTRSDTGALNHLYESLGMDVDRWVEEFPAVPDQIGLLAFLGSRPLGMDVIGSRRLYAPLHERLLRGYVMDALGSMAKPVAVGPKRAQAFLDRVTAANRVESPTVGLGRYAVLSGAVIGGELTNDSHVVHLSAFPGRSGGQAERGPRGVDNPIAPPSRRRRRSE